MVRHLRALEERDAGLDPRRRREVVRRGLLLALACLVVAVAVALLAPALLPVGLAHSLGLDPGPGR